MSICAQIDYNLSEAFLREANLASSGTTQLFKGRIYGDINSMDHYAATESKRDEVAEQLNHEIRCFMSARDRLISGISRLRTLSSSHAGVRGRSPGI